MHAQQLLALGPRHGGAVLVGMGRDHEALVAAPACAHAEDVHAVEHGGDRRALDAVAQREREQARRAFELLLPVLVAGAVRQGRVQHLVDLGPGLQPVGDLEAALLMVAQAHAHRAEAAQGEVAIVGRGVEAERLAGRLCDLEHLARGTGDDAHHRVGVTDDVLGSGVDGDIAAVVERLEVERRRPGIIDHDGRAGLFGDGGHAVDVLYLEGLRARRLEIDDLGVGPHQLGEAFAADHRIEVGGLDSEALQRGVGEAARRTVGIVGHQHVVAGLQEAHDGAGDGGQPRLHGDGTMRALDGGDGVFQRLLRRRAVASIAVSLERDSVLELVHRRREDRRRVIDGRIDDAEVVVGIAAGDGQNGVGSGISFLRGHESIMAQASSRRPVIDLRGPSRSACRRVHPIRSRSRHRPRPRARR